MPQIVAVRPAFWNVPLWAEIGVYVLGLLAIGLMVAGIVHAVKLRRGQAPAPAADPQSHDRGRWLYMLKEAFWQYRIRQTDGGNVHFALFWGFVLLFCGTAIATIDWDVAHLLFDRRILTGNVYLVYKFVLDLAGLVSLLAIAWFFWRRFGAHDMRVEPSGRFVLILGSLAFIIISGFALECLRLAVEQPVWSKVSFVGHVLAMPLIGADPAFLRTVHTYVWVVHGLTALVFVAAIPLTFYGHMFKTPVSIFWHKTAPMGSVAKIDNIEEQETFGISDFKQFTTLDRIRLDGCTECGRCRSRCPAVKAGTPLDPKNLVTTLQARLRNPNLDKPLIGGLVSKEALWSCTTCGACAKVCPAQIPIPDLIVAMRRHLALEQGEFPEGLATALENAASVGNPWGMDPGSRLKWAKGLDVPTAKAGEKYDVLFWVGCSASYDRRAQKIARAMVEIFQAAGVKFAVMAEERCHADWARRSGEEYLFQTAALENIESIGRYTFDEIVAVCPHCFNTLKNEYPQFEGGKWKVTSHVQFIARLLADKRIDVDRAGKASVTLHDACYLARYNKIGRDPRAIVETLGRPLKETPERGCNANCCGAGGGQIFMDRPARINTIRIQELRAAGGDEILVSCPHCMTMIDSAQAQDTKTPAKPVRDIAEAVASSLKTKPADASGPSGADTAG